MKFLVALLIAFMLTAHAWAVTTIHVVPTSGQVTVDTGNGVPFYAFPQIQVGPGGVLQAPGAKVALAPVRLDYSSTNVTTSAWVQLVASLAAPVTQVCVFDSSGKTLKLGVGAAASEVAQILIFPGGNGCEPLSIPSASRVSIEAVSATASSGELDVNLYQ